MNGATCRPWRTADVPFLWDMLFESLHVRDGGQPFARNVLDRPEIAHYLTDFGQRDGDDAQLAESGGVPVGAAWCRRLDSLDPGYGYVSDDIPELGMAVRSEWRRRGVGRRLLGDLLDRNPTMSLSVDDENVSAAHLYRSLGFVVHDSTNGSTTMVRRAR
ncbi:GNAT family N-acetyltransferase [Ilumatobacter nonamiensis]|uniref:GNAT family N-acetyltransferase n=1 Tax=Ilumatobacter nonamiensis TaxID=467093 RepID=UPI0003452B19|nr:GNAT family N-acetyltransferase [Ilumatobacter nonamiensis]